MLPHSLTMPSTGLAMADVPVAIGRVLRPQRSREEVVEAGITIRIDLDRLGHVDGEPA